MSDQDFLKLLKEEAKTVGSLQREKFVPDELSGLANFVATNTWQVLLGVAIIISLFWEIMIYQGVK